MTEPAATEPAAAGPAPAEPEAPSVPLKWHQYRTEASARSSDLFAWLFSAALAVHLAVFGPTGGGLLGWLIVPVNFALGHYDEKRLKAEGHEAPNSWWACLVPVYLWKRATLLRHRRHYFWLWTGLFVLGMMMPDEAGRRAYLEETATGIVTQIYQKQDPWSEPKCKVVRIGDRISDGFYRAVAVMADGTELDITIEQADGEVVVRVRGER